MEYKEILVTLVIFILGIFGTLGMRNTPFMKLFLVTATVAVMVLLEKGPLESMVFFLIFVPSLFLQKSKRSKYVKDRSSKTIEKIIVYLSFLPLFGLALVFRENLDALNGNWTFPDKVLRNFEVGLVTLSFYWAFEWSKRRRSAK